MLVFIYVILLSQLLATGSGFVNSTLLSNPNDESVSLDYLLGKCKRHILVLFHATYLVLVVELLENILLRFPTSRFRCENRMSPEENEIDV